MIMCLNKTIPVTLVGVQNLLRVSTMMMLVLSTLNLYDFVARRITQFESLLGVRLMNKNQVEGRAKEAKGKVKEAFGKVTGNKETEYKGKAEKQGGKAKAKYGDVKKDIKKETD